MKDKRSVSIVFELVKWLVELVTPLVSAAYVSRILGTSLLGLFSYSLTIVSYFVLPVSVGVQEYGSRECVFAEFDRQELEETASQIALIQMLGGTLMFLACMCVLRGYHHTELIWLIQSVRILAAMTDLSWLFRGFEAHAKLARIRIRIKMITLGVTFLLVKKGRHPLETYALIQSLGLLALSLTQAAVLKKNGFCFRFNFGQMDRHWFPLLMIFIPSFALEIFHMMDRTMLGILSDMDQLGLYSAADRYIHIPMGLMTSLFTLLIPCAIRNRKKAEALSLYLSGTLELVLFLGVILAGVLAGCAGVFFQVLYGEAFAVSAGVALLLTPALFTGTLSDWYRKLYLLPQCHYRQDMLSVVCGMAVNFAVNLKLIPLYGAYGAAAGTVAAGMTVLIIQLGDPQRCAVVLRKSVCLKLLCSILLYGVLNVSVSFLPVSAVWKLLLQVCGGGVLAVFILLYVLDRETLLMLVRDGFELGKIQEYEYE